MLETCRINSRDACDYVAIGLSSSDSGKRHSSGFTLIELLVVLAIVALLASLAMPRYFQSIDTAKETVLADNLRMTRETIDKFYADTGRYPETLNELVEKKYLRSLPFDPIVDSAINWVLEAPEASDKGSIYSIKSSAPGADRNGKLFADF
ncbi:type II secretion system protein [Undibacterium parvum]|nr:prepilin-type N-terminal cleavage/methylation domain-containing protein [Undibacterium parvum]